MRILQQGFSDHIASGATTLATCWRLTRRDGLVLGFTDHDVALEFEGTRFDSALGLDGGATAAKLGAQVDNSEVSGFLHVDAVTENDILLGRYDGAEVETWRVNWRDPSVRHLLRRDTIGEITREDGVFRLELRSAQHALNVARGRIYQNLCSAELGDNRCGINLEAAAFKAETVVTDVRGRQSVAVTLLSGFKSGWFNFGRATWTAGARQGKTDRLVTQIQHAGETVLAFNQPVGDWVEAGDTLTLHAGCDRRFATCRQKFANSVNFRGFPHIPGNDFILRYPRPGADFHGRPLVK